MKKCKICNREFHSEEMISGMSIRSGIEKLIKRDYPDWTEKDVICKDDFNKYRADYIETLISEELGNLEKLDKDVIKSIKEHEIIAIKSNKSQRKKETFGERLSDKIAKFGGSWVFIIVFFLVLFSWIGLNANWVLHKAFDPFPFILMNLILSCLAAIQAPIIMMSQNRQESKDRARAENDYKIDLKSEIEIRTLHEKIDHILFNQWTKTMNIHEMQIEILNEIRQEVKELKSNQRMS